MVVSRRSSARQLWLTTATQMDANCPPSRWIATPAASCTTSRCSRSRSRSSASVQQLRLALTGARGGARYVTFGYAGTAAIDVKTGKVLWERRDLECNHFRGAGSSPIIFRNLLDHALRRHRRAVRRRARQATAARRSGARRGRSTSRIWIPTESRWRTATSARRSRRRTSSPSTTNRSSSAWAAKRLCLRTDDREGTMAPRGSRQPHGEHAPRVRPGMLFYPTGFDSAKLVAVRPDGSGTVTQTHVAWRSRARCRTSRRFCWSAIVIYMVNDVGLAVGGRRQERRADLAVVASAARFRPRRSQLPDASTCSTKTARRRCSRRAASSRSSRRISSTTASWRRGRGGRRALPAHADGPLPDRRDQEVARTLPP